MRILGVIPARGGSKRVPRKNLQVVGGKTLVEHAIDHAREAHLLDMVVVSTRDTDVIAVASRLGVPWVCRPTELCLDDTPMAPVLLHAAEATGGNWDAVVTIQPTSPLRTARDIDRAIAEYLELYGYQDDIWPAVSINAATKERNGAVYVTPIAYLESSRGFPAGRVFAGGTLDAEYPMPASRSLDINTPEDLEEARRILGP